MQTLLSYYPWAESPFHISAGLAMGYHLSIKSLLPTSSFDRLSYCFLIWFLQLLSAGSTSDRPQYGRSAKAENQPTRCSQSKSAQETKHTFQKSVWVKLRMRCRYTSGSSHEGIWEGFILTSNSKVWPLSDSQLVSFSLLSIPSLWRY